MMFSLPLFDNRKTLKRKQVALQVYKKGICIFFNVLPADANGLDQDIPNPNFFNILHFYRYIKSAKNFLILKVLTLCVSRLGQEFFVKISSGVRIRVNVRVKTARVKASRVKKSPTHINYSSISAARPRG